MDAELRAFLEDRFGLLGQQLEAVGQRVGSVERRLETVEERLDTEVGNLRGEIGQLGILLESVKEQVRLVAEGHSVLYGAIDRQYEEVRAELRDVRALLRVWNDLVTRRLADLELQIREKAG